jgi:hypothetical protein
MSPTAALLAGQSKAINVYEQYTSADTMIEIMSFSQAVIVTVRQEEPITSGMEIG